MVLVVTTAPSDLSLFTMTTTVPSGFLVTAAPALDPFSSSRSPNVVHTEELEPECSLARGLEEAFANERDPLSEEDRVNFLSV